MINSIDIIGRFLGSIAFIFIACSCSGQASESYVTALNKEQVDSLLNTIVLDEHYIDRDKELKIVFAFKVDSLGEVHSAHIIWNVNLKSDVHYNICRSVESTLNAKFMYDECRDKEVAQKYAVCNFPYYPDK